MKTSPAPPTGASALVDLGPEIAVYRGRRFRPLDLLTVCLPGLAAVVAPLAYGIQRYYDAYTHYGPAAATAWNAPWFLLSGVGLAAFILLLLYRLLLARRQVVIHRDGLSLRRVAGARRLPYAQLTGIAVSTTQATFLGRPLPARWQAWLFPTVGRPVRLDNSLEQLPELISRLKASLYTRLLPALQADFHRGAWVFFGPIAVQEQALRLGRQTIPWSQVSRLDVRNGDLQISLQSPEGVRRLPASRIPNLELLFQILRPEA